jgi:hypothetical protein
MAVADDLSLDPATRTEGIVLALMNTHALPRARAEALLDLHAADRLREIDEELNTLDNPNPRWRRRAWNQWAQGVHAAQQRVFMKELRLRMGAARKDSLKTSRTLPRTLPQE